MYKGAPGINKLANALSARMKQATRLPLLLEFGSIGNDYSLQADTFPISMPASDYTICRSTVYGQEDGEAMKRIMPGDRVLVAWVQNEPVVIDIILPADVLNGGD